MLCCIVHRLTYWLKLINLYILCRIPYGQPGRSHGFKSRRQCAEHYGVKICSLNTGAPRRLIVVRIELGCPTLARATSACLAMTDYISSWPHQPAYAKAKYTHILTKPSRQQAVFVTICHSS